MNVGIPRLRMFAGPNGSGKSTLKTVLPHVLLGVYINPDEIEIEIKQTGSIDLSPFQIILPEGDNRSLLECLSQGYRAQNRSTGFLERVSIENNRINFPIEDIDSYLASQLAEFFRNKLIEKRISFTFETVMSHFSKVEVLQSAQESGFRTYLYYVATDDPDINISRVRNRVKLGGHPVSEDKIRERYVRSLSLLREAIGHTNRAFIFDNSSEGKEKTWIAEITEGRELQIKADQPPAWFRDAVWMKFLPKP